MFPSRSEENAIESTIGRETRMNVARRVDGQPLNVLAVFVGGPDIPQIGEGNLAGVIIGIADQLCLSGRGETLDRRRGGSGKAKTGLVMVSFRKRCSSPATILCRVG